MPSGAWTSWLSTTRAPLRGNHKEKKKLSNLKFNGFRDARSRAALSGLRLAGMLAGRVASPPAAAPPAAPVFLLRGPCISISLGLFGVISCLLRKVSSHSHALDLPCRLSTSAVLLVRIHAVPTTEVGNEHRSADQVIILLMRCVHVRPRAHHLASLLTCES